MGGDCGGSMMGCTINCYSIRCLLLLCLLVSDFVVNSVVVFSFFKLWFCLFYLYDLWRPGCYGVFVLFGLFMLRTGGGYLVAFYDG